MKNITKLKGNMYPENDFHLACVFCGVKNHLHLTAHRNGKSQIVGLIVACDDCLKDDQDLSIEIKPSIKKVSPCT